MTPALTDDELTEYLRKKKISDIDLLTASERQRLFDIPARSKARPREVAKKPARRPATRTAARPAARRTASAARIPA